MEMNLKTICEEVATATHLKEGAVGVEAILRCIHQEQPVSPKKVAFQLGLPIPLVSAVRRELEHQGWLLRQGGMIFPDKIKEYLDQFWGNEKRPKSHVPPLKPDSSSTYIPLTVVNGEPGLDRYTILLEEILGRRPEPERKWDQSHATAETVQRRAELFLEYGWIQGKKSLFLGDDDLTSIASMLLVREQLGDQPLMNTFSVVLEIDPRLVQYIRGIAMMEDLPIEVIEFDYRQPLPEPLEQTFDFFFTDPPYTSAGARMALTRGVQALSQAGIKKGALAIPLSPPELQQATQEGLLETGFLIDFLIPGFNEYIGATMQGGTSALYGLHLSTQKRLPNKSHEGPFYTRDYH